MVKYQGIFIKIISFILTLVIVFLQEGFSYYVSFQVLGLVLITILLIFSKSKISLSLNFLFSYIMLIGFIVISSLLLPEAISRNSSNIFFTVIAICTYAFIILAFMNLHIKRLDIVLRVLYNVSVSVIVILSSLLFLSDLNLLPFLSREAFLIQNTDLITNFRAIDMLEQHFMTGLVVGNDLFYGEPSYLGLVFFVCISCYMFISRLLLFYNLGSFAISKYYNYIVALSIVSLFYIDSFSSIIYGFIVTLSVIKNTHKSRAFLAGKKYLALPLATATLFIFGNYEYLFDRILTLQDSLSLFQRFGSLLDLTFIDFMFGLHDTSRMPEEGFHNGFFYIIAISGIAGINFLFYILHTAYLQSKNFNIHILISLILLAIIMQNGAIFSPNKLVLFSLILLPVSCSKILKNRHPVL